MTLALFVALSAPLVSVEIPAAAPQLVFDRLGEKLGEKLVVGKGLEDKFLVVRFREKSRDHVLAKVAEAMDGEWKAEPDKLTLMPNLKSQRAKIRRDAVVKIFAEQLDRFPREVGTEDEQLELLRQRIRAAARLYSSDRRAASSMSRTLWQANPMQRLMVALMRSLGPEFFADHCDRPWIMARTGGKARLGFGPAQLALIDARLAQRKKHVALWQEEAKQLSPEERSSLAVPLGFMGGSELDGSLRDDGQVILSLSNSFTGIDLDFFDVPGKGVAMGSLVSLRFDRARLREVVGTDPPILSQVAGELDLTAEDREQFRLLRGFEVDPDPTWIDSGSNLRNLKEQWRKKYPLQQEPDTILHLASKILIQVAKAVDRDLVAVVPDQASLKLLLSEDEAGKLLLRPTFQEMRGELGEKILDDGKTLVFYPLDDKTFPRINRTHLGQWIASVSALRGFNVKSILQLILEMDSLAGESYWKIVRRFTDNPNIDHMSTTSDTTGYRFLDSLFPQQLQMAMEKGLTLSAQQLSPLQRDRLIPYSHEMDAGLGVFPAPPPVFFPDGFPDQYRVRVMPTLATEVLPMSAEGASQGAFHPETYGARLQSLKIQPGADGNIPGLELDLHQALTLTISIQLPGEDWEDVDYLRFVVDLRKGLRYIDLPPEIRRRIEEGRKQSAPSESDSPGKRAS